MKALLVLTFLCMVNITCAQNKEVATATSAWVHINTKAFAETKAPKPSKAHVYINDDFTNPSNPYGWRTSGLSGATYQRGNGTYRITTTTVATDVISVIDTKCNLDSADFELEATVASNSDILPRAGVVWGYKDKDNYMAFRMNSKGECAFIFMNSGENVEDSGYKFYSQINKSSHNKLKVKKKGVELTFYINDIQATSGQYGYMGNSRAGFVTSDKDTSFKEFKFYQLSN